MIDFFQTCARYLPGFEVSDILLVMFFNDFENTVRGQPASFFFFFFQPNDPVRLPSILALLCGSQVRFSVSAHSFTSGQLLVKGWVLVFISSLPKKSMVRIADRPDITSTVYCGRKAKFKQSQPNYTL